MLTRIMALLLLTSAFVMAEEEVIEREFDIAVGGTVSVKNINGGIKVHGWDGETVKVRAVKRAKRGNVAKKMANTKVEFDSSSDRLDIETVRLKRGSKWNNNMSVSYELWIPAEVNVKARSTNGGIKVEGVSGEVNADTTNGNVTLSEISGSVNADTTNGSIKVSLSQHNGRDMNFHTTNGSIRLAAPQSFSASLSARTTNGSINTDFPIEVYGQISKRKLKGEINGGGANVEMKTTNGSIRITEI